MRVTGWGAAALVVVAALLAACDAAPAEGVAPSCAAYGTAEAGTLSARMTEGRDTLTVRPRCLRAAVGDGRTTVRAVRLSGALNEGEIVLTVASEAPGVYSLASNTASARFVRRGVVYPATEASVALVGVGADVIGTFDFSTADGPRFAAGTFTIPRDGAAPRRGPRTSTE